MENELNISPENFFNDKQKEVFDYAKSFLIGLSFREAKDIIMALLAHVEKNSIISE